MALQILTSAAGSGTGTPFTCTLTTATAWAEGDVLLFHVWEDGVTGTASGYTRTTEYVTNVTDENYYIYYRTLGAADPLVGTTTSATCVFTNTANVIWGAWAVRGVTSIDSIHEPDSTALLGNPDTKRDRWEYNGATTGTYTIAIDEDGTYDVGARLELYAVNSENGSGGSGSWDLSDFINIFPTTLTQSGAAYASKYSSLTYTWGTNLRQYVFALRVASSGCPTEAAASTSVNLGVTTATTNTIGAYRHVFAITGAAGTPPNISPDAQRNYNRLRATVTALPFYLDSRILRGMDEDV